MSEKWISEMPTIRPGVAKRLANGFRINASGAWCHCEETNRIAGSDYPCGDQTRYRCNSCGQFVCADHQRQHRRDCDPPVPDTEDAQK